MDISVIVSENFVQCKCYIYVTSRIQVFHYTADLLSSKYVLLNKNVHQILLKAQQNCFGLVLVQAQEINLNLKKRF